MRQPTSPPRLLAGLAGVPLAALLAGCGSGLPPTPTSPTWTTASSAAPTSTTTAPATTPPPATAVALAEVEPDVVAPRPPRAPAVPRTSLRGGATTRTPAPRSVHAPTSSTVTKAASGAVVFRNCAEAKAAGAAPLRRGEPGYRAALDRDDDGVACER